MQGESPAAGEVTPRVCVLLPTYNNDPTLEGVLEQLPAYLPDILVVNDGCTDRTSEILKRFPQIDVVTHPVNQGKGMALRSGFARARERGFTHAITMDSDGQHLPAELPRFLEAIQASPGAIVVGVRDLSGDGPPKKSRYLRMNSNFWTWVETGEWVADTQSGYRAYPLEPIQQIAYQTTRYDFEIEVLVKAMWFGVPVVEVPVSARYNTGSRSHFRPLPDFSLVTRLNVRLIVQRLFLPPVLLQVIHHRSFQEEPFGRRVVIIARGAVLHEHPTPGRLAMAVGVGATCSILPIWGFQMAVAMLLAHYLRLSRVLTMMASNLSFPPFIPFLIYGSLLVGRRVVRGVWDSSISLAQIRAEGFGGALLEYAIGSVVLAFSVGIGLALVAYVLARLLSRPVEEAR